MNARREVTTDHSFPSESPPPTCAAKRTRRDPSLRSGFRLRTRTPAKRLNLPKGIAASTLGVFRTGFIRETRLVDNHECGEGK